MKMDAYQRLRRKLKREKRISRLQDVSDAADGVQQLLWELFVDFIAQAEDEHVDNIRLGIEAVVPDVLENHGFGDDAPGVAHQEFEEREFAGLEFDLLAGASHFAGEKVEGQVGNGQAGRFGRFGGATNRRLDAGEQLGKSERLDEIIIAAGLQAFDAIVDGGFGTEDEDGNLDVLAAQGLHERKAIEFGEHHIDHGGVKGRVARHEQALFAIGAMVDRKAALLEAIDHKR